MIYEFERDEVRQALLNYLDRHDYPVGVDDSIRVRLESDGSGFEFVTTLQGQEDE